MEKITIEISLKEVENLLDTRFNANQSNKILRECIINNLASSEQGIKNLILALQGVVPHISDYNIKIGDRITVKVDALNSWKFDKPAMHKAQIILNDTIECEVIGYNNTRTSCFEVKHTYIADSGPKILISEAQIRPNYIITK